MNTFNGLPLYEDMITSEDCGMLRISLVDLPAVDSDFQKFGKPVRVVLQSEEQRLILGVVARANYPIYRYDETNGEYYIMFSKETIRKMAEKYLDENRQNRVNLMHCGEEMRGVQMVQLFIKDSAKGIVPAGFEDIEDGSLFAEFHVEDPDIWNWIKDGILRGFSLEGIFSMQETEISEDMKLNFQKMKSLVARMVAKFAQITTDKGVLTFEGDMLEVGDDVYILHEDGEVSDAEDGEYITEDGTTIVIVNSKVEDIREKAEEPVDEEPEAEGEPVAEEMAEEDEPVAEEEPEEVADDVDIHNLAAEVERLKEDLADKDAKIAALEERVAALEGKNEETAEALSKMAVAKPAHEEVNGEAKAPSFRNKHEKMLYELNRSLKK